jgi:hypothetical protein
MHKLIMAKINMNNYGSYQNGKNIYGKIKHG